MTGDVVREWASVYPHIRYEAPLDAIPWLTRVFGFRERVRTERPDGAGIIISKLEAPGGGFVMVAASSPELKRWMQQRVRDFREPTERPWPNLSHATTIMVNHVDAHYSRAKAEGATTLGVPMDQPWGLRTYAALDLEGHQWEFAQLLHTVEPEAWGRDSCRLTPRSTGSGLVSRRRQSFDRLSGI